MIYKSSILKCITNQASPKLLYTAAERGGASVVEIHEITQRSVQRMMSATSSLEQNQVCFRCNSRFPPNRQPYVTGKINAIIEYTHISLQQPLQSCRPAVEFPPCSLPVFPSQTLFRCQSSPSGFLLHRTGSVQFTIPGIGRFRLCGGFFIIFLRFAQHGSNRCHCRSPPVSYPLWYSQRSHSLRILVSMYCSLFLFSSFIVL